MNKFYIKDANLFNFWNSWKKANRNYKAVFPENRLQFPEPLTKFIAEKIDSSLISTNKNADPYDFKGNIEVKSSAKRRGVTPFKKTQNECKRILFFLIINDVIEYYDINDESILKNINDDIDSGKYNSIILENYISCIPKTIIIINK